jgi:hypothetical protein
VPERILQHDLRFVDLVFDVYGNLENRYNENRFLALCREILISEIAEISERTGGNFSLFAARFASGTTVFGRLASRYLRAPHVSVCMLTVSLNHFESRTNQSLYSFLFFNKYLLFDYHIYNSDYCQHELILNLF